MPGVRTRVSRRVWSSGLSEPILAPVEDRGPEGAGRVGQVDPLVGRHLELLFAVGRPLDRADVPVVGRDACSWPSSGKTALTWLAGVFQSMTSRELDAARRAAGRQADGLDEDRALGLAADLDRRRGPARSRRPGPWPGRRRRPGPAGSDRPNPCSRPATGAGLSVLISSRAGAAREAPGRRPCRRWRPRRRRRSGSRGSGSSRATRARP